MSHNGLHNGIYQGLFNGLENGLYNGLLNGIVAPTSEQVVFTFDPDALAYIQAANINNPHYKIAINNFVVQLKYNNLWNKFYAIYPYIGGSASSHKWNLKDSRDLDAAYRVTFTSGISHDSNGIKGNGTSGTATFYFNPSVNGTLNDLSLGFYSRTSGNSTGAEFAVNAASTRVNLIIQYTNGNTYFDLNNAYLGTVVGLGTTATGLYVSSRTASNVIKLFRRGVLISSKTNATTTAMTGNLSFGVLAGGGYSNRACSYAHIAKGFTDGEVSILNGLVQDLQIKLGRNIY